MYNQPQPQQSSIKINDDKIGGAYSNIMLAWHTKEEFGMDFIVEFMGQGIVNSRVITSPGHFKRMVKAMQDNVKKYEEKFGEIKEAESVSEEIGFKDKGE